MPAIDASDQRTADALRKRAEEVSVILRTGTTQLIRKRQATMGETLSREGLSAATALQSQIVRCIFGLSSTADSEGCQDLAVFTCKTCEAICCDFHLSHDLHKDFVNETAILKQQQALAQQKIAIEAAPVVAPAKETGTEGDTAKAKGDKAPRKNTWADLLQRYHRITSKDYEKPAGQKVGDFQLMVEGLEGRQEPAGEKGTGRRSLGPAVIQTLQPVAALPAPNTSAILSGTENLFAEFEAFQAFLAFKKGSQVSIPLISTHAATAPTDNDPNASENEEEFV